MSTDARTRDDQHQYIVDQDGKKVAVIVPIGEYESLVAPRPALAVGRGPYDFQDLVGGLSWRGDPLATQKSLRDEW
jgi:hypothetical protein